MSHMEAEKVVLISGGTSGIGLACAADLLGKGWKAAINGRDADRGDRALRQLSEKGDVCYIPGDVSHEADCQTIVDKTIARFGRIDGLITSAGVYREGLIDDETYTSVLDMFSINVFGTIFLCKSALPEIRRQKGAIVTIGSDAGLQGNISCSIYGATKGAIVSFTKSLALEEAPHEVRVNCICPGDVATPMLKRQIELDPDLSEKSIQAQYPLYRIATAEEIAHVAAFLLSPEASYVTAAAWPVDGGLTSW